MQKKATIDKKYNKKLRRDEQQPKRTQEETKKEFGKYQKQPIE